MDIEGLLKSLHAHKVRFVVIGAAAFPVHGYSRVTFDIDVFIQPTLPNARRTWRALSDFGYDLTDITVESLLAKKLLIRQYALDTDIHPFVKGATFERVWKHRVYKKVGDILIAFASLPDLIRMKRAAGRAKDREDLKYLRDLARTA